MWQGLMAVGSRVYNRQSVGLGLVEAAPEAAMLSAELP
jgi:hypothetical protein